MKITKEWLEEQGWKIYNYDIVISGERFYYATKMFGRDKVHINDRLDLTIYRDYKEDSDVYADCLIDDVTTVEKLNATLELCGIQSVTNRHDLMFQDALYRIPEPATNCNALTWQDVKRIVNALFSMLQSTISVKSDEEFYTEVLKRFNEK